MSDSFNFGTDAQQPVALEIDRRTPPEDAPREPVPVDEETPALAKIDFITRKSVRDAREQRARGFLFNLKHSGGKAHVRRLAIMERGVILSLPSEIQSKVIQATAEAQTNKSAIKPSGSIDMKTYVGNITRNEDAYNAVCVAGFIRPHLVLSEALIQDPEDVVVTDLDIFDRHAYFVWCNGGEVEPDRIAPFLE